MTAGDGKTGLVLEGGAMRGLFSAGVIDALMDRGFRPDGVIGVSAGAAFGCNYKSGQRGRVIRYNTLMAKDWRYCSLRSLLLTGDLFGAEYDYHYVPDNIDIFDRAAFDASPMEFKVVCTDVDSGEAVYKRLDRADYDMLEWIRASASMPLVSRVVELEGRRLLDGGITDSIPLRHFENNGYSRNIVVLTRPEGYRKKPGRLPLVARLVLRRYPRLVEAWERRPVMYNAQLDYVEEARREGRAIVVRPPHPLPIGHVCHDPALMRRVYETGLEAGRAIPLEQFLDNG